MCAPVKALVKMAVLYVVATPWMKPSRTVAAGEPEALATPDVGRRERQSSKLKTFGRPLSPAGLWRVPDFQLMLHIEKHSFSQLVPHIQLLPVPSEGSGQWPPREATVSRSRYRTNSQSARSMLSFGHPRTYSVSHSNSRRNERPLTGGGVIVQSLRSVTSVKRMLQRTKKRDRNSNFFKKKRIKPKVLFLTGTHTIPPWGVHLS